jgi:RimJ/RimL family protein N-acetyltransferase
MLTIRPASMDDALDILEWRNDPGSRAMFRDGNAVAEEDHMRWFSSAIARDDRRFFIGEADGQKVGVIRFDRQQEGTWEINNNMAPAARGRGLGKKMMLAVLEQFDVPLIVAEIRQDNVPSWHIYEGAGFKLTGEDATYRRYALVR